jgi:hypothetical protein
VRVGLMREREGGRVRVSLGAAPTPSNKKEIGVHVGASANHLLAVIAVAAAKV